MELLRPGRQPNSKRICYRCHGLIGKDPETLGEWVDTTTIAAPGYAYKRQVRQCAFCFRQTTVMFRYLQYVSPELLKKHQLLHELYFVQAQEKKRRKAK